MRHIGPIVGIVLLLGAAGCAKRPVAGSGGMAAVAARPFTNQELV
jgi:hypothetical protein